MCLPKPAANKVDALECGDWSPLWDFGRVDAGPKSQSGVEPTQSKRLFQCRLQRFHTDQRRLACEVLADVCRHFSGGFLIRQEGNQFFCRARGSRSLQCDDRVWPKPAADELQGASGFLVRRIADDREL